MPGLREHTDIGTRTLLLVVHDDKFREILAELLRDLAFEVIELSDGIEALNYMATCDVYPDALPWPDLIVADMEMPSFGGLDLLEGIGESEPNPPVILISPTDDEDMRREAYRLGSWLVLEDCADPGVISEFIAELLSEDQLPNIHWPSMAQMSHVHEPALPG
ncbi:MAG: response regulator [Bradymonadaceae bacterium]